MSHSELDILAAALKIYLNSYKERDLTGKEAGEELNKELLSIEEKLREDYAKGLINQSELKNNFCSNKIIKNITGETQKKDTFSISNFSNVFLFTERFTKVPWERHMDLYSLLVYRKGYKQFIREDCNNASQDSSKVSPLSDNFLNDFFSIDTYLFVPDEEMFIGTKTRSKDLYYPKIDALVLSRFGDKSFKLRDRPNKKGHGDAKINWIDDNNKDAFQMIFEDSWRKLILRFSLPIKTFRNNKLDIILGLFIITLEDGVTHSGRAVLMKNKETVSLQPFQYDHLYPEQRQIAPQIIDYLFNRYLSWMKLPDNNIYNIESLQEWIENKNDNNYTRARPTKFKFLFTFPITSTKDKDFSNRTIKSLNDCLYDFKNNNHVSNEVKALIRTDPKIETVDQLVDGIDAYLTRKREKILVYPEFLQNINQDGPDRINKGMIEYINQSINVVYIIPDYDFKDYDKISSIYTMIGYSIALKRNTFILCKNPQYLPFILQIENPNLNLYVWSYEKLEEIPYLFYFKDPVKKSIPKG